MPEDLIESAQIDGAGKLQSFFHVILPQITGFMNICIILCLTGSLKAFDHSWIMTGGDRECAPHTWEYSCISRPL